MAGGRNVQFWVKEFRLKVKGVRIGRSTVKADKLHVYNVNVLQITLKICFHA